ncbi:inositol 1,3,4-trisphosphate 5/6-kinase 4, partial [Morus notabilis]|uniref:inositol 1,3,4-trisphosphate 5/6-kinase 4 n=1 Tax=Morus notabilis TaxID=981085 RepID=UPI000CED5EBF
FSQAISYDDALSSPKVDLLKSTATLYSMHCFSLDNEEAIEQIKRDVKGVILYVVSIHKKDLFLKQLIPNLQIAFLNVEGANVYENSNIICINKLEELPLTICRVNRKAMGNDVVTIGYIMKPSREEDFAKRGAFPLYPTRDGLMFLPLTFELPLAPQLQEVDIILHKATDEIISIDMTGTAEFANRITFTRGMQELKRYMDHPPDCCVIDQLDKIYPVLDRLKIQQTLLGLQDLNAPGRQIIRGPHFLKVNDFRDPSLDQKLSGAKLSLPSIVKPQVACGVAHAHNMAIVFKVEDFKDLKVPLPAIIQEYVDHSSTLYKFYVLGDKVFNAVKKSTPNAHILMKLCGDDELKPLVFDSLKSLPTADEKQLCGDNIDHGLVTEAAKWLARNLGLTIFGFDVVIQEGSRDHVIVDVNYLPSFKEVPEGVAIPAFWDAIKKKLESKRTT